VVEVVNASAELVQTLLIESQRAGANPSGLARFKEGLEIVPVRRLVVGGTEQGFNQLLGRATLAVLYLADV
jgi:hypothetical protein